MCSAQSEKLAKTKSIESQCNHWNRKIYWYCDKKQIAQISKNLISFIIVGHVKGSATDPVLSLVLLIFWVVVGTRPLTENKEEKARKKREIQENMIKIRLAQKIDNANPYQSIQPILPGQQAYPVQFEPLAHIRLSRSTYKVTTFIEFKSYINSFRKFQTYLETFLTDLTDSKRVSAFTHLLSNKLTSVAQDLITKIITEHKCEKETPEEACSGNALRRGGSQQLFELACREEFQLVCRAIDQFKAMTNATMHVKSAFEQVKEQFLSVIDHLETEQDQTDEETRDEHNEKVETDMKIAFSRVSKEELEELETILKQVETKYPDVKKNLKRHKRFGVMSWVLGWGVYSNYKQVKAIKKNIRKLYFQNVLQERQIQDLVHYLNLTATRVRLHDRILYNIQLRLYRIDHYIKDLQDLITFNWYVNNLLMDANVIVNRLITGLIVLRNNVEVIYRYLSVIASHEVNPVMIPPPL